MNEELSEWEVAARRAIHECQAQLSTGTYNVHNILHILEKAA
jgi:hypothetical protein